MDVFIIMSVVVLSITLLFLIYLPVSFCINLKLIFDYFKLQNTFVVTAHVCHKKDALLLIKNLNTDKFRLKVHTTDSNDNLQFKARQYAQGIFIDLTCDYNRKLIENERKPMNTSFKWFAWLGRESFNYLNGSPISTDTDFVVATADGMLYEAYRKSPALSPTFNLIGNWTTSGELTIGSRPFRDLTGATLRGSVFVYELKIDKKNYSEVILNNMIEPDMDLFHRFHFALGEDLRFFYKYDLQPVFTNATGHLLPNGKFAGIVGEVGYNRSDIGLSPTRFVEERAKIISYLPAVQLFRIIYAFMNPKTLGTFKGLLIPLSKEVWASVAGIILITVACYYFIQRYSSNREDDYEISAGFLYAIGLMAQQGLVCNSITSSFRFMSLLLLILALILSLYYNSSIMYGLLSAAPTKIKTVDQLLDSDLGLGMLDVPYLTLKENYDRYILKKAQKKISRTKDSTLDITTGLERVRRGKFAFIAEDELVRRIANRRFNDDEKCDLKELELTTFAISLPLQKNSPYMELFTRGLLWLREAGISKRLKDHWYQKPAFCLGGTKFVHVTLEAVSAALLIFVTGVILSVIIFIGECRFMKHKQNNNRGRRNQEF